MSSHGEDKLKDTILTFQRVYAVQVVKTENQMSMEDLEQIMKENDAAVSQLNSEVEAFKKSMGKDIKNISS